MNTSIHEALPADVPFMEQMLYLAAVPESIPEDYRPSFDRVITFEWFNRYINDWGRADDIGFVARENGLPAGATWYRRFTSTEMVELQRSCDVVLPPYELAIGLEKSARGKRIGSRLVGSLLEGAEKRGIVSMCLSVSDDNSVAQRLYRNSGFEVVGGDSKSKVMLWSSERS